MFCTACGAAASNGDRFCRQCGRVLGGDAPSPSSPAAVPRIVTASPRPVKPRRHLLRTGLRLLSLAGMVPSLVGAWMLIREPTAVSAGPAPARTAEVVASPSSPARSASPSALPSPGGEPAVETLSCLSTFLGYVVSYPSNLVTLDRPAKHACRYFDTERFEAPHGSGLPATQIRIYPSANTYRHYDRLFDPETNSDLVSRLNLEIDGYAGMRIEVETHGEEGDSRLYAYVVDVAGQVLVLDTWKGYDPDYSEAKVNLDAVVAGLRFGSEGTS